MTLLRRPGALISTLLILLMGAAFLTQVVPYGQIVEANRQVTEAETQLAELEAENADLTADVEALQTDAEIEKLAREKLGYVRPGETAYVVLDPPGTPDDSTIAPETTPEDKTWVDRVWEFISGEDLG
ncbi:MAG TPA: septum formation initiator family protein [Acidimicrobiia bacterium]|nr:septum formation initiator family protein [Acidimicrobiia bacterium]